MHVRKHLVAAALALPLATGLTACGELGQAQQGLDKARACFDALQLTRFTPDLANLERAQADAQAKAAEAGALAERVGDRTLKQNLLDLRASLDQVADGQVTLQNSLQWTQAHLDKASAVATTCGDTGGG